VFLVDAGFDAFALDFQAGAAGLAAGRIGGPGGEGAETFKQ
jgi:hypothetical protein